MGDPLFSVIIPTHSRPRYLADAIDSVLGQTVEDLECIVVDDASPEPVAVPFEPRVRLLRREVTGGPAAARNTGLAEARGRYVIFLDDDDLFLPERMELALEGLQRAPVAICGSRFVDGPAGPVRRLQGDVRSTILDFLVPQVGTTAVERETVCRFDERFFGSEDVDWWLTLSQVAPVETVERVGHLYRLHDGLRPRHCVSERIRDNLLILEMHADYFAAHPRAEAFRWKRLGLWYQKLGDHHAARRAFTRSLLIRPQIRNLRHLARSLRSSVARFEMPEPPIGGQVGT